MPSRNLHDDILKIQIIRNDTKALAEWEAGDLTRAEKRKILDEMEFADSPAWIVRAIEDIREMREQNAS